MEAYVINLDSSKDRWSKIQKDFAGTDIKLNRWQAIRGADLTEDEIKEITTDFCYHFCSSGAIGCWLSHYTLWKHIIDKKIDRALILEDDAYPVENFNQLYEKYWNAVPQDWDIVYFGCTNSQEGLLYDLLRFCNFAGKTEKVNDYVLKPGYPLGAFAYLLSYKGAVKLLQSGYFDKMSYHVDLVLPQVYKDSQIKVYAFKNNLICPHNETSEGSNIQIDSHPLLMLIGSQIHLSDTTTLDTALSSHIIQHRKSKLTINGLLLILIILAIIISALFSKNIVYAYLLIILVVFLA